LLYLLYHLFSLIIEKQTHSDPEIRGQAKPWKVFVPINSKVCSEEALDLVDKVLRYYISLKQNNLI